MLLLVDGYNLLHVSGIFGPAGAPPTLEQSRLALLEFLAVHLPEALRRRTTIVFDAAAAPPGLPSQLTHADISVRFARRKQSADDLIAELIMEEPDPRHLRVVSSDHAVQRSARQRGAKFVDSEVWLRELRQAANMSGTQHAGGVSDKPAGVSGNPFPPGYAEAEAAELLAFDELPKRGNSSRRRKS